MRKPIRIENIVASTKIEIDEPLDLRSIAFGIDNANYDPDRFSGIIYKTTNPKTTTLIFSSGKLVCTGAKNIGDVHKGLETLFNKLRELDIQINNKPEIIVQNVVASADLEKDLNLDRIAFSLGPENIEYEPEQFPGLVYRIEKPKSVLLMFGSGKIIVTGNNSEKNAQLVVDEIVEKLEEFGLY